MLRRVREAFVYIAQFDNDQPTPITNSLEVHISWLDSLYPVIAPWRLSVAALV